MMVVHHGLDGVGMGAISVPQSNIVYASSVVEGRAIVDNRVRKGIIASGSMSQIIVDGNVVNYFSKTQPRPPQEPIPVNAISVASTPETEVVMLANGVESNGNGANGNGAPACPAGQEWSDLINRCFVVGQEDPQVISDWWVEQQKAAAQGQSIVESPVPGSLIASGISTVAVPPVPVRQPRPPLYQDFEDCIPGDDTCMARNRARTAANQAILTNHGNEYLLKQCLRSNVLNHNAGNPELKRDCESLHPMLTIPIVPAAVAVPTLVAFGGEAASLETLTQTVSNAVGVESMQETVGTSFQIPSGVTDVLTGEVVQGVPNWMLAVGLLVGLTLMRGRG